MLVWIYIFIALFYVLYFGMPIIFSIKKYPDFCTGRVICTKILVIITKLLCYIFAFYIVWVAFGLFGWFSLLLLVFAKWIFAIPIIVSLTALFLHHSWEELFFTALIILPFCHYVKIQIVNFKTNRNEDV